MLEREQSLVPELIEPPPQRPNAPSVNCVDASRALGMNSHQSCCLQDLQVLRDGWTAHRHALGDLRNRSLAVPQAFQHSPAGRISQGIEDALFVSNHLR